MPDGTRASKDKEIYSRIDRFVLAVLSIVKIFPRDFSKLVNFDILLISGPTYELIFPIYEFIYSI